LVDPSGGHRLREGEGMDGEAGAPMAQAPDRGALLRVAGLSKTFPGTLALDDVDIDVHSGEVHALVGHNGSGKSTLIKVLAGYHEPDAGAEVWLVDHRATFGELGHSRHGHGGRVSFVHQDLGLVLELSAVDNLALHGGFSRTRLGRVRWREQHRTAQRLMAPFGIDLDLDRPLAQATPVERTIVAIAAALQGWDSHDGVLVLDEPTAVLPPNEVGRLFDIVRGLRTGGAGVLYVSHRLDEIFALADRVTVLRNGRKVGTSDVAAITKSQLVGMMLGREMEPEYRAAVPSEVTAEPVLEVRDLAGRYVRSVSFSLARGEVLGIAGLPSSGRDELPRLLTDRTEGAIGGEVRLTSRSASWLPAHGWSAGDLALLPPDRGREGVLPAMSVGENLSVSVLDSLGSPVRLDHAREERMWWSWIDQLSVKTESARASIATLSGGNQQKVLFGRTLARQPQVLVLCEPTAGVDIGARHAIYDLVADQVRDGLSVIVASSDTGDLLALCTRVLVLDGGVVVRELAGGELSEHELVHAMEGSGSEKTR
jgi:ABC-type sugar transport system ATPase subunit